eukprot:scaffold6503_cov99-Amphora_coffeaeformis.AAC.1
MPRSTERQKAITRARRLFRFFVRLCALTQALPSDNEEDHDGEESMESFSSESSSSEIQRLLAWSFARLYRKERNRYEDRKSYRSH